MFNINNLFSDDKTKTTQPQKKEQWQSEHGIAKANADPFHKYVVLEDGVIFARETSDWAANKIMFTQEPFPIGFELLDVSAMQDRSVMAWMDDGVMHVSTGNDHTRLQFPERSCFMFYQKPDLFEIDWGNTDMSRVVRMDSMFFDCPNLRSVDMAPFADAHIEDVARLFGQCKSLRYIDNLDKLDVSRCHSFSAMFMNDTSMRIVDLSAWNCPELFSIKEMFQNCPNLHTVNLGNLKVIDIPPDFHGDRFYCMKGLEDPFYATKSLTTLVTSDARIAEKFTNISERDPFSTRERKVVSPTSSWKPPKMEDKSHDKLLTNPNL